VTKSDQLATVLAIISLVIAFMALLISWQAKRIQRSEHKLNLAAAEEKGRLQAVEGFYRDKRKHLGLGFRIRNGPDEVTVTSAKITITYTSIDSDAILVGDEKFTLSFLSDDFRLLGMTGPEFGFSLGSRRETEWRFPYLVSFDLSKGSGYKQIPGLEFIFSVTASGIPKSSSPLRLGSFDGRKPLFGYRRGQTNFHAPDLESVILGTLARKVLQSTNSAELISDLKLVLEQLARGYIEMPAGLQNWLLDSWEEAGSFSDDMNEKLARALVKLLPPRPDPLTALDQSLSKDQPPSIASDRGGTAPPDTTPDTEL
jgi:hypothetical protein